MEKCKVEGSRKESELLAESVSPADLAAADSFLDALTPWPSAHTRPADASSRIPAAVSLVSLSALFALDDRRRKNHARHGLAAHLMPAHHLHQLHQQKNQRQHT